MNSVDIYRLSKDMNRLEFQNEPPIQSMRLRFGALFALQHEAALLIHDEPRIPSELERAMELLEQASPALRRIVAWFIHLVQMHVTILKSIVHKMVWIFLTMLPFVDPREFLANETIDPTPTQALQDFVRRRRHMIVSVVDEDYPFIGVDLFSHDKSLIIEAISGNNHTPHQSPSSAFTKIALKHASIRIPYFEASQTIQSLPRQQIEEFQLLVKGCNSSEQSLVNGFRFTGDGEDKEEIIWPRLTSLHMILSCWSTNEMEAWMQQGMFHISRWAPRLEKLYIHITRSWHHEGWDGSRVLQSLTRWLSSYKPSTQPFNVGLDVTLHFADHLLFAGASDADLDEFVQSALEFRGRKLRLCFGEEIMGWDRFLRLLDTLSKRYTGSTTKHGTLAILDVEMAGYHFLSDQEVSAQSRANFTKLRALLPNLPSKRLVIHDLNAFFHELRLRPEEERTLLLAIAQNVHIQDFDLTFGRESIYATEEGQEISQYPYSFFETFQRQLKPIYQRNHLIQHWLKPLLARSDYLHAKSGLWAPALARMGVDSHTVGATPIFLALQACFGTDSRDF